MPIGDFFPEELREQLSENNLKIGSVLRYGRTDTNPPKPKFGVVVGFDAYNIWFASVYINSEINPYLFPTQRLRDLHLPLEAKDSSYLSHDSFVDCSQIHVDDVNTIKTLMTNDINIHVGNLSDADCKQVLATLKTAHTIPAKIKQRYGLM